MPPAATPPGSWPPSSSAPAIRAPRSRPICAKNSGSLRTPSSSTASLRAASRPSRQARAKPAGARERSSRRGIALCAIPLGREARAQPAGAPEGGRAAVVQLRAQAQELDDVGGAAEGVGDHRAVGERDRRQRLVVDERDEDLALQGP